MRVENSAKFAIHIEGDFTFESLPLTNEDKSKSVGRGQTNEAEKETKDASPFILKAVHLEVARGE